MLGLKEEPLPPVEQPLGQPSFSSRGLNRLGSQVDVDLHGSFLAAQNRRYPVEPDRSLLLRCEVSRCEVRGISRPPPGRAIPTRPDPAAPQASSRG